MRMALFARSGVVAIALLTASVISFPSFPSPAAGWINSSSAPSVNRTLKGDRLQQLTEPVIQTHELGLPVSPAQSRAKVPVGCDGAFSPISSPRLAGVFRRCMA